MKKNIRFNYIAWAGSLCVLMIFVFIGYAIYLIETERISDVASRIDLLKQSVRMPSLPTTAPTLGPGKHYVWRLQKKDGTIVGRLFTFPPGKREEPLNIVKIKDTLFYTDYDRQKVMSMDINTGKVRNVFDMPKEYRVPTDTLGQGMFDISTFEDILLITVNQETAGFAREGKTYAVRISDPDTIIEVADFPGSMAHINERLYLTRHDSGDTCGGRRTYAALNPDTLHATKIADTSTGCRKGDVFIAIDNDQMILANSDGNTGPGGPFFDGLAHYKYVYALSVDHPDIKQGIVAEQEMPAATTDITYDPKKHALILIGESVHVVHLDTHVNEKIAELPAGWTNMWIEKMEGDRICIVHPLHNTKDYGGDGLIVDGLDVNVNTHEVAKDTAFCPNNEGYTFNHPELQSTGRQSNTAESLGMPGYKFVLTKERDEK